MVSYVGQGEAEWRGVSSGGLREPEDHDVAATACASKSRVASAVGSTWGQLACRRTEEVPGPAGFPRHLQRSTQATGAEE